MIWELNTSDKILSIAYIRIYIQQLPAGKLESYVGCSGSCTVRKPSGFLQPAIAQRSCESTLLPLSHSPTSSFTRSAGVHCLAVLGQLWAMDIWLFGSIHHNGMCIPLLTTAWLRWSQQPSHHFTHWIQLKELFLSHGPHIWNKNKD